MPFVLSTRSTDNRLIGFLVRVRLWGGYAKLRRVRSETARLAECPSGSLPFFLRLAKAVECTAPNLESGSHQYRGKGRNIHSVDSTALATSEQVLLKALDHHESPLLQPAGDFPGTLPSVLKHL